MEDMEDMDAEPPPDQSKRVYHDLIYRDWSKMPPQAAAMINSIALLWHMNQINRLMCKPRFAKSN